MFRRKSKSNPVGAHPGRRAERHPTDGFTCRLGAVRDLSTSGMRVEASKRPDVAVGDVLELRLRTPGGQLVLKTQIVRVARKGLRGYDIGIRFLELRRGTQSVLDSLARFGFVGFDDAPSVGGSAPPPRIGNVPQPPRSKRDPDLPDYYMALGVGPMATEQNIREAFRVMAWRYHPDVSNDPDGQAKFSLAHEAYKALRDPDSRSRYDRKRAG